MHARLSQVVGAAILAASVAFASAALAENTGAAAAPPKPSNEGQGMMNGPTMMGNGANMMGMMGMMGMMSAMTRMANACADMMESAARAPATPGKPAAGPSHG